MKRFIQSLSVRADVIAQVFAYIRREKMWFLVPAAILLLLLSLLIVFAQASPFAPFIYTLF